MNRLPQFYCGPPCMTSLYVPGISSPSAPASADWNWHSNCTEPERAASCTWRGKPQPPQAWSRRWKQGGFIRLLSGLMLEPSTPRPWRGPRSLRRFGRDPCQPNSVAGKQQGADDDRWLIDQFLRKSSTSAGLIVSSVRTSAGSTLTATRRPRPGTGSNGPPRCGRKAQRGRSRQPSTRATVHHGFNRISEGMRPPPWPDQSRTVRRGRTRWRGGQ